MASEKQNYPYIPVKSWWALRKQFNQSIPQRVTPSYLVAALNSTEGAAKDVLRGLQIVGIVDDDGFTTERAKLWRDDTSYAEVCRQIRDELYPTELLDTNPGPEIDREATRRWYMATTGNGIKAANRMVAMYALLAEADPFAGDEAKSNKSTKSVPRELKARQTTLDDSQQTKSTNHQQDLSHTPFYGLEMPEMRLSVEIRIDASVTVEQIDQIFASMVKYLYRREDEGQ